MRIKHLPGQHDQLLHGDRGVNKISPAVRYATFVLNHDQGESIDPDLENFQHDFKVDGVQYDNQGDWARAVLTKDGIDRTIGESAGILTKADRPKLEMLANLDGGFAPHAVVIEKEPKEIGMDADLSEWGYEKYGIRPANLRAQGWWDAPDYKAGTPWVIHIADDPGHSRAEVFWHELGHTLSDNTIRQVVGDRGDSENTGDWTDRFAAKMTSMKIKDRIDLIRLKHLPGQHDQETHGDRPGTEAQPGYKFPDKFKQVENTNPNPHGGYFRAGHFWIMPDDRIFEVEDHTASAAQFFRENKIKMDKDQGEHENMVNKIGAIRITSGWGGGGDGELGIDVANLDKSMLERIQGLITSKKLFIKPRANISIDQYRQATGKGYVVNTNKSELMSATGFEIRRGPLGPVKTLKERLKHLPGQHDQETHGDRGGHIDEHLLTAEDGTQKEPLVSLSKTTWGFITPTGDAIHGQVNDLHPIWVRTAFPDKSIDDLYQEGYARFRYKKDRYLMVEFNWPMSKDAKNAVSDLLQAHPDIEVSYDIHGHPNKKEISEADDRDQFEKLMGIRTKQRTKAVNPAPDFAEFPDDLAAILKKATQEIDALFIRLQAGDIDIETWQSFMKKLLAKYNLASWQTGANVDSMTAAQRAQLTQRLAEQYDYLNGFAKAMNAAQAKWDALPPEEQTKLPPPLQKFQWRARQYGRSTVPTYWAANTEKLPLPALPGEGSQCLNNCKCRWEIKNIDEQKGDFDCTWKMGKAEHCQTCLERAVRWNPLRIRDWQLVLPNMQVLNEDVGEGRPQVNVTNDLKELIGKIALKHLPGQHNQDSHGWRFGKGEFSGKISNNSEAEIAGRRMTVGGSDLKSARRKLSKALQAHFPDSTPDEIDTLERVMALDEAHFRKYADQLGMKFDDGFIQQYFRQEKESDRLSLVKKLNQEYKQSYHEKYVPGVSDRWENQTERKVGPDVRDAQTACDSINVDTRVEPGMNEDDCNLSLSTFVNLAHEHPVVKSLVAKGAVKKVVFETNRNSSAAANANMPNQVTVLQPRYSKADVYLHEIGHLTREHYDLDLPYNLFSEGKKISTYKTLDPEEQFAEWFGKITQADGASLASMKKWRPDTFQFMIDNVPELKSYVESAQ